MGRVLTTILPVYWSLHFAHAAIDGAGTAVRKSDAGTLLSAPASLTTDLQLLLALGNALTGALFVWMFLTALFDDGDARGETDEVAKTTFAAAVLTASAGFAASRLGGVEGADLFSAGALAALLASYIVIHAERVTAAANRQAEGDRRRAAAAIMALGAAHSSALSAMRAPSRPPVLVPANDEGDV